MSILMPKKNDLFDRLMDRRDGLKDHKNLFSTQSKASRDYKDRIQTVVTQRDVDRAVKAWADAGMVDDLHLVAPAGDDAPVLDLVVPTYYRVSSDGRGFEKLGDGIVEPTLNTSIMISGGRWNVEPGPHPGDMLKQIPPKVGEQASAMDCIKVIAGYEANVDARESRIEVRGNAKVMAEDCIVEIVSPRKDAYDLANYYADCGVDVPDSLRQEVISFSTDDRPYFIEVGVPKEGDSLKLLASGNQTIYGLGRLPDAKIADVILRDGAMMQYQRYPGGEPITEAVPELTIVQKGKSGFQADDVKDQNKVVSSKDGMFESSSSVNNYAGKMALAAANDHLASMSDTSKGLEYD